MMLCGGHGRSLKSNRCVDGNSTVPSGPGVPIPAIDERGPWIVDNSPAEKLSIVDQIRLAPHSSCILKSWNRA